MRKTRQNTVERLSLPPKKNGSLFTVHLPSAIASIVTPGSSIRWGLTPCSMVWPVLPLVQASRNQRAGSQAVFLVKEAAISTQTNGQARVVIEGVTPEIDCGRFAIKRVPGEEVSVEADIFSDGHDLLSAVLKWRPLDEKTWSEIPMEPVVNDRWRGSFTPASAGTYLYSIEGWIDRFATWRRDLDKKVRAKQEVTIELQAGAELIADVLEKASGVSGQESEAAGHELKTAARTLIGKEAVPLTAKVALALSSRLAELMARFAPRHYAASYAHELQVIVDPPLARFGAWYELFPRSCSPVPGKHGTFQDCAALLPGIAEMGFDVVYLPPIHPVGTTHRKGRNNAPA